MSKSSAVLFNSFRLIHLIAQKEETALVGRTFTAELGLDGMLFNDKIYIE